MGFNSADTLVCLREGWGARCGGVMGGVGGRGEGGGGVEGILLVVA